MIDYTAIAQAGGIPKISGPSREAKREQKTRKNSTLTTKKRLKQAVHIIPKEVKEAALEKSRFCLCGFCPVCGGQPVTIKDDFHHFPHKAHGGKDIPEHGWIAKHECHMYLHDYPDVEKEVFEQIEAVGYPVVWKVPIKGVL